MRKRVLSAIVGALLAFSATAAFAQEDFPNRPIRVVTPYAPGAIVDVFGRIVAQGMATQWNGATIVFESKSGANGSIAAEDVARAAPDGYTWLIVTTFFTASPALYKELRWDPQRDFIPVGEICRARTSSSCRRACR
jgi:tripartite-type tricarboxylate transporter receptor subunit TctC